MARNAFRALGAAIAARTAGRLLGGLAGKGRSKPRAEEDLGTRSFIYPPNKGPHDRFNTRKALEAQNPGSRVTSTTIPKTSDRGMAYQDKSGIEAMRAVQRPV